ncbi:hypothetical protein EW093_10215 [Thiospirochaeta perfilievii]|uniref:Type II/III secretion system secretin-like domain-containing protein n=1 Tax=Thiospirochaeta perfilievii TaxID=252967 RepID=A0A5C1QC81_9SPIO|nr:hypothetical protein [Thiospirochaeta perfilievii]QEN05067.1 hypothetical protein EW093_10215 [Thiospirochaeta perfilievii]
MKLKNQTLTLLFIIVFTPRLYSQAQVLEFDNKPVTDVLLVLADLTGKNIIPDESVTGNCSYYFTTENIDKALNLFLQSQKLYLTEADGVYRVSKIEINIDSESRISLNCDSVDLKLILDRLSTLGGKTILYDRLEADKISLNIKTLELKVVLEIIMKKYNDYVIEENENYYYIKKDIQDPNSLTNGLTETDGIVVNDKELYSINLNRVRFSMVIKELFTKAGKEYSLQGRNDNIIERINYKDKTLEQMLNLILEEGSSDYVLSNNIYYIFDINKTEIANRHILTRIIKLENILVKDLLKLMPGSFMSNNVLKVDEDTNSVIVYGTNIKTEPIIQFIDLIDRDLQKRPRLIKTSFISADNFKNILLKQYSQSSIINMDKDSFLILLTDNEYKELLLLKNQMDLAPKSHTITLKYIKSEDLLDNLPKTVNLDQIVTTPNPSVIYYYGEDQAYRSFLAELDKMDKPVPQLKYKILVLQNSIGDDFTFGINTKAHSEGNGDITLPEDEWSAFSGNLGNLLGLNFNVLSAFGPLFSFELNAALNNNRSKILVDTTLQALSGKKVSFRNTTTSRFYQTTVNSDGDVEKTGATQEVSWGIILDIEGWTSGDGMVTVSVQSTLSDETTVSGDNSGIPSTSEKIVNTEVRTREGVPVVIGGLISSKKETTQEKTPLLGDIPLLGFLFRKNVERQTQSEFTIYLLPYIEDGLLDNIDKKMEKAYKEFL